MLISWLPGQTPSIFGFLQGKERKGLGKTPRLREGLTFLPYPPAFCQGQRACERLTACEGVPRAHPAFWHKLLDGTSAWFLFVALRIPELLVLVTNQPSAARKLSEFQVVVMESRNPSPCYLRTNLNVSKCTAAFGYSLWLKTPATTTTTTQTTTTTTTTIATTTINTTTTSETATRHTFDLCCFGALKGASKVPLSLW